MDGATNKIYTYRHTRSLHDAVPICQTVYENMAFGLRIAKAGRAEIDAAVRRAAAILSIESLLDRPPAALSGGQRQRLAIGRAIVRQPPLFLFAEPLSQLDADLPRRFRTAIAALHRTTGPPTLYTPPDHTQAQTLPHPHDQRAQN